MRPTPPASSILWPACAPSFPPRCKPVSVSVKVVAPMIISVKGILSVKRDKVMPMMTASMLVLIAVMRTRRQLGWGCVSGSVSS